MATIYWALDRVLMSPWGRVLKAIREDETAAVALGKSARRFRLEAFVLGSTLMGLAGALYVSFIGFVSPFDFLPTVTFQVWAMLIVGGSGNNRGALLGALVVWAIWAGSGVAVAKLVPPSHAAQGAADPGHPDRPAPDARAALSPARADRRGGGCLAARERLSSLRLRRGYKGKDKMERRRRSAVVLAVALMAGVLSAETAPAQSCPVKVGGVLPLTGSMAPITKKIAQGAELAIEHVNQGGGVKGCPVQFISGRPGAADGGRGRRQVPGRGRARTGVHRHHILGNHRSDHCLGDGAVQGGADHVLLHRKRLHARRPERRVLLPYHSTSKTQAYATASETVRRGMKKTVVIYVNTDFGTDMLRFYKAAVAKLGREVIAEVPYNDNQPSYRARSRAARGEARIDAAHRIPQGRRHHRARVAVARGHKADRAQQLDAHHGLRQRRGREVRRGLLRHGQRAGGRPRTSTRSTVVRGEVKADSRDPACTRSTTP